MPVALLRPPTIRKLAELLRPLSVRERTTILAQAVREGTMTRARADQVLIAIEGDCRRPSRNALTMLCPC
jgi:hypothetical protein